MLDEWDRRFLRKQAIAYLKGIRAKLPPEYREAVDKALEELENDNFYPVELESAVLYPLGKETNYRIYVDEDPVYGRATVHEGENRYASSRIHENRGYHVISSSTEGVGYHSVRLEENEENYKGFRLVSPTSSEPGIHGLLLPHPEEKGKVLYLHIDKKTYHLKKK